MPDFAYLQRRLDQLADRQRRRQLVPRDVQTTALVTRDGRRLHNFGSNDYLGLASEAIQASSESVTARGATASALVCGWTMQHQHLADQLAELETSEAAVVFPSGYAACCGTIATLAEAGDLILSDQLNHASLIDGCRLSRAECVVYPHRDSRFLEDVLQRRRHEFQRVWIVSDGVFSMDGHLAPLVQLCDLADHFDAHMIVDEAHGTGVLGARGSGVCEALGVKERIPVRIGTLSKAIGAQGGFVVGPQMVIDYLVNACRTLIYSTALAPASVRSAIAGIESVYQEPQRRETVRKLANQVRSRLGLLAGDAEQGFEAAVPIIPWIVGSDRKALEMQCQLFEAGFYVPAIRPPTVPEGSARLRISLSAGHTPEVVEDLCRALLDATDRSTG